MERTEYRRSTPRPDVRAVLCDKDGVLFDWDTKQALPGAVEFVDACRDREVPFLLVTNNCQESPAEMSRTLRQLGLDIAPEQIFSPPQAIALDIARKDPGGSVFVFGSDALKQAMTDAGLTLVTDQSTPADHVVAGELDHDRRPDGSINAEAIYRAHTLAAHGASVYSTDGPGGKIETGGDFYIKAGSWGRMIAQNTGQQCQIGGKPSPLLMEMATQHLGVEPQDVMMVGDSPADVEFGGSTASPADPDRRAQTALVLSGNSSERHLETMPHKPDAVFDSVADLVDRVGDPDPLHGRPPVLEVARDSGQPSVVQAFRSTVDEGSSLVPGRDLAIAAPKPATTATATAASSAASPSKPVRAWMSRTAPNERGA